jgi:hypothetical protein
LGWEKALWGQDQWQDLGIDKLLVSKLGKQMVSSGFEIISRTSQSLSEDIQWVWNHHRARVDILIAETWCSCIQTIG